MAEAAEVAESFLARGVGLIGRKDWSRGDGLVILPCNSVHCFFMSIPIDVAYVDSKGSVCRLAPNLKPWRIGPIALRARYVVELPAGTLDRTACQIGDRLELVPVQ